MSYLQIFFIALLVGFAIGDLVMFVIGLSKGNNINVGDKFILTILWLSSAASMYNDWT